MYILLYLNVVVWRTHCTVAKCDGLEYTVAKCGGLECTVAKCGSPENTVHCSSFYREYLATFKKTVAMHEVFLQRLAAHPTLRQDVNFEVFLEFEGDVSQCLFSTLLCGCFDQDVKLTSLN